MNTSSFRNSGKILCIVFLLSVPFSLTTLQAQDYWNRIPAYTSQCYSENDEFVKKIHQLRTEVKEQLEASKKKAEEAAAKMTNEQKMAIASKYQNMKPDEIVKFQNEMMELTQAQAAFQQLSAEYETRYNQVEADFRAEFGQKLGPIDAEYNKLPDGEGTPQWAIKKGEELILRYNSVYEEICGKYLTNSDAKFKLWLSDFNKFLHDHEVPFNQKMIKSQYGQLGITPDESAASLMALDRYLEKCAVIFGLRKSYRQG
jgi:hypothetical protein